ncbi:MAG: hypothetical protein J6W54_11380 [Fibrobacter sp.]|uniref:hypothetical protein n=1 Tax=Fibrobacter sp. TaxID=35828 RepID=UPI001AFF07A9|nr:hypothetical protein [Fibrobacter sp.]MBO7061677.1 hypothetical protein [Fibrobacter sp.]
MNYKKILPFLISSAFLFAACGDDSSSTSADPSTEESSESQDSSSSKGEAKSSSSKKDTAESSSSKKTDAKSSSSKKDDTESSSSKKTSDKSSSSQDKASTPSSDKPSEGKRAAKLEDLEKNYELKLFDQTVYLSTGSKQGVIALRIPNELWAVTYTDFANGVVSFEKDNTGLQYSETDAANKIAEKVKEGFKISFVVDKDGKVLYSVDDSEDYSEAVKASVAVQKGKISKAENIQDKIYECADGDSTKIFKFFDNSYICETSVDDSVMNWHAGRYDIQRSTLLMRPLHHYAGWLRTMFNYSVGTDNTITTFKGEIMNCTVKDVEYDYEKAEDFVGEWVATNDGVEWTFSLNADGTSKLEAFEDGEKVEYKSGTWEIYGYYMLINNKMYMHPGSTPSIYGQLQTGPIDRKTGKISGFSYIHSDPDTPHIPTSFEPSK